jgi:hypothetical protein
MDIIEMMKQMMQEAVQEFSNSEQKFSYEQPKKEKTIPVPVKQKSKEEIIQTTEIENIKSDFLQFDEDEFQKAIIYSEILKRPYN